MDFHTCFSRDLSCSWMYTNSPRRKFAYERVMRPARSISIPGTSGRLTRWNCARCLDTVVEEVSKDFDLIYRPMASIRKDEEIRLNLDDTDVAFFEGDGLFLADVLAEQVNLSLPMKVICRSDCRGLCPHCGANLNQEECRCETHATDARMAPLARLKQDWPKKQ